MDFGAELRQARERKGLTLREIAESTKISARTLDALEKNDLGRLPGGIFTRAVIRSYASEIGLDPDQAMRSFTDNFPGEGSGWSPTQTDDNFESRRQAAGVVLGILALAVAVGAVFLLLSLRRQTSAPPPRQEVAAQQTPPPAPVAPPAKPVEISAAPVVSPAESAPENPDGLAIGLQPTGPCWISVTADGRRLFSRQMVAGETETANGTRELLISIGDAGAFRFTLNGLPGRVVGKPGEVATLRITRENYRSFLSTQ